jgi:hypothetical protein
MDKNSFSRASSLGLITTGSPDHRQNAHDPVEEPEARRTILFLAIKVTFTVGQYNFTRLHSFTLHNALFFIITTFRTSNLFSRIHKFK